MVIIPKRNFLGLFVQLIGMIASWILYWHFGYGLLAVLGIGVAGILAGEAFPMWRGKPTCSNCRAAIESNDSGCGHCGTHFVSE